jgi:hypothetical protein
MRFRQNVRTVLTPRAHRFGHYFIVHIVNRISPRTPAAVHPQARWLSEGAPARRCATLDVLRPHRQMQRARLKSADIAKKRFSPICHETPSGWNF